MANYTPPGENPKPKRKSGTSDDDLVSEGRKAFQTCLDAEQDNRKTALEDRKFARELIQWPDAIRTQREREGRPCLTIDKLGAFRRQVVNDARQNKPQIKVKPVDSGADPKTADIISGLIRNIEYTSNADVAYDTGVECAVDGGLGYWRVGLDYAYDDSFDLDINIMRVSNPFSVYGDPNSRLADSSDWDVAFVTDRLTKEQFEREYPGAEQVNWDDDSWSGVPEWINNDGVLIAEWWTRDKVDEQIFLFEDLRPEAKQKVIVLRKEDLEDQDIQMALQMGFLQFKQERETKTCKVTQRCMSGLEILKEEKWIGRYIPIVPVYGDEFDIEGKRFFRSLIHSAKDAQIMFNIWRTHSTEMVGLAPKVPFIGPKGAFDSDIERWTTANIKSHAYLEYDPVALANGQPPQRQPLDMGVAAGALQEALNASDDMKAIMGLHDAALGAKSNETSGKAIMARQREGDVSTFHFQDNLARAIRHTGRIILDLIPKVYTKERIIRVIGEDGEESSQTVNAEAPERDKKGNIVTKDGQPPSDDMTNVVMATHNLTVGKYDLIVSTGPSFTSRREEAAMHMTEIAKNFPPAAPIIAPLLAKNLDWPGADDLAEKFEQLAQNQIPDEVKQKIEEGQKRIEQLEQENQQLKLDQTAEMEKLKVTAQLEQQKMAAQIQLEREKAEAEIQMERIKLNAQLQIEQMKAGVQMQVAQQKVQNDARIAGQKADNEAFVADRKLDIADRTAKENSRIKAQQAKKPPPRANA